MYCTYYTLNVYGPSSDCEAADKYVEEEAQKGNISEATDTMFVDGSLDGEWENKDRDMEKISKAFPSLLFHIDGSGDEQDDLWQERWKNGVSEHITIGWPPFTTPELLIEGVD